MCMYLRTLLLVEHFSVSVVLEVISQCGNQTAGSFHLILDQRLRVRNCS